MSRMFRIAAAAAAVVALSGCGILFPGPHERAAKNTPGFKSGYTDGCASATIQDTNYRHDTIRDEALYKTDKNYRSGWASGFYNCRTNRTHEATTPGVGPIPDNSPGGHPY